MSCRQADISGLELSSRDREERRAKGEDAEGGRQGVDPSHQDRAGCAVPPGHGSAWS